MMNLTMTFLIEKLHTIGWPWSALSNQTFWFFFLSCCKYLKVYRIWHTMTTGQYLQIVKQKTMYSFTTKTREEFFENALELNFTNRTTISYKRYIVLIQWSIFLLSVVYIRYLNTIFIHFFQSVNSTQYMQRLIQFWSEQVTINI